MTKKDNTATDKTAFSFDNLSDVHADIQDKSPEPNAPAIEAQGAADAETIASSDSVTDKKGTVFDPKLHAVDGDGNPSVTPLGKFRKRRGLSKVSVTNQQLIDADKAKKDRIAARAAGQLAADLMIGSACTLLGPEWVPMGADGEQKPQEFDEQSNLRKAFADYFEARGISDFPPGIMLSIAISSYAMPRVVAGKETKTRLSAARKWFGKKWKKWTTPKAKKDATQPDSRDNGERENDTGKTTVSDEPPEPTRHARS